MKTLRYSLIIALWFASSTAQARQEAPRQALSDRAYFERFDETNRLPDGTARKIIQDRHGQMWIATQAGIVRYDGISFEPFVPQHDADSPPVRNIWGLEEAPDGRIWAGAGFGGGVARFDQSTQTFETFRLPAVPEMPDPVLTNSVSALHVDPASNAWVLSRSPDGRTVTFWIDAATGQVVRPEIDRNDPAKLSGEVQAFWGVPSMLNAKDGKVWMATQTGGLHLFDPDTGSLERLYVPQDSTDGRIFLRFFQRENGDVWASRVTALGEGVERDYGAVCRLETAPFEMTCIDVQMEGRPQVVLAFAEAEDASLIVTSLRGWCRIADGSESIQCHALYPVSGPLPQGFGAAFPSIQRDASGNLWTNVIAGAEPLTILNPSTGESRNVAVTTGPGDADPADGIAHLMTDRKGTLWAGGFWSGLNRLDQERARFEVFSDAESSDLRLPGRNIRDLSENPDGSVWVATERGAIRFDPDRGITGRIGAAKPIPVEDIVQRRDGSIVFSSRDSIFSVSASLGAPRFLRKLDGLRRTTDMMEDSRGVLWIGHNEGLILTDATLRELTSVPIMRNPMAAVSDSISQEEVMGLVEDSQGYVWISTDEGGLNRFDPATGLYRSLFHPFWNIGGRPVELPDGTVWGSSYGGAIIRVDGTTGEHSPVELDSEYPRRGLGSLIRDLNGDVWVPSFDGLSRIDGETLEVAHFDQASGLPVNRFMGSRAMTRDGSIWLSTRDGVLRFHPDNMQADIHVPAVVIRSVVHGEPAIDESVLESRAISVAHDDNDLTFHFFAVDFDAPERNRYRYRMLGLEEEWVDVAGLTYVRLSNVPPGRYTFEIIAANADGVWSETPASIAVRVRPPWWNSIWAYFVYLVLAGVALRRFDRWNTARIERTAREEQRERELQQARELAKAHEELATSHATLQATQKQLIEQEKLASLGSLTAGIAHEIKNPLNFVNNFAEVGAEMADELREAAVAGRTEEVLAIITELQENATQITKHGRRADSIVKAMMQHASGRASEREEVAVNAFIEEYANLAWHGMRAKDEGFQADLVRDYSEDVGSLSVLPQELGRVVLNLLSNAFDAVKGLSNGQVTLQTRNMNGAIEIRVSDNGPGIPDDIRGKIFEPFFTTKATGEGTGLGLSLSYDIITKGHGGTMTVAKAEGGGAVFIVTIPK